MQNASGKFLAGSITIALLAFLFICLLWPGSTSQPKLSVTYIQPLHDYSRFQFGITNVGKRTVFTSNFGKIELLEYTNVLEVHATAPLRKLGPGQGQLVEAILSEAQKDTVDWGGKWRFTCFYAGDGLRSRIYHWQWGPTGPGARANRLVPGKLKGMPLTVKGTSDWIPAARKP